MLTKLEGALFSVEIEYRRVKNLRLTVYPPDGRVALVAPLGTEDGFIRAFVEKKRPWIVSHREACRKRAALRAGQGADKENQSLWGIPHRLVTVELRGGGRSGIHLEREAAPQGAAPQGAAEYRMVMALRPGAGEEKKQALLDAFYRRALEAALPELIARWEKRLGLRVKGLYIRKMKAHWGSCNHRRGTIRLNSELARRDPRCLEYVLVHEMIHLIEPSHNRYFYQILEAHLPQWKQIRKAMNRGDL